LQLRIVVIMTRHALTSPAVTLAALAVLPLTACAASNGGSEGGDGPAVVAAMYPLEYVADRILGGAGHVETLTSPGVEPHDVELTVRQTASVIEADVVVYLDGFQEAVDGAVDQTGSEHVVDASTSADLIPGSEDASEHEGVHEGVQGDPHFWLDPVRLSAVAADVSDAVAEADPDNADTYATNLEELQADLEELDRDISRGLASCARDTVVVSHNAFQYFAVRYGLHMHSIAGLSPDAEPSPQHVTELLDLIEEEDVTTVFSETLASPAMAETLSSDLGLDTAVLDPVEGLADETADEDYLSLMRGNLAALQKANGC
jgi:zinc transport system substrate-binding protein